jgi:glycosyltransferase involved in cell wall biosynthesis
VLLPMLKDKAVIGSAIGGIPEQIRDGETGVLVPPDVPEALAHAMLRLVGDRAERLRLGENAGRWVRKEISPTTQGAHINSMYDEVLRAASTGTNRRADSVPGTFPSFR